jgi:hypothetical protein
MERFLEKCFLIFIISVRTINNAIFYYITQPEIRAELRGRGVVLGRIPCFFFDPALKKLGFFVGLKRFIKNRLTNSENKIDFKTSKAANARSRESPKGRLGCNKPTKQKNSMAIFPLASQRVVFGEVFRS